MPIEDSPIWARSTPHFTASDMERIMEIIEESYAMPEPPPDWLGTFASFRPSDAMDDWATVPISTPFGTHEYNARTEYDAARRWMNSHFPPENLNDIEPIGSYRFVNGVGFQRADLISSDVMRELTWEWDGVKDDIHNQDTPMSLNDLLFPNE